MPGLDSSFGYSIFLCSGLLTWGFFADLVVRYQNMFLENANVIKKINFPRICIPVIALLNAGISFIIILSLFVGFMLFVGSFPGGVLILIIPVLLLQTTLAMGLGMTVGILNVFFRDIGHLFAIVLQFWFWLTPIVYPLQSLPDWAQEIVNLNPMTPLITALQNYVTRYHTWWAADEVDAHQVAWMRIGMAQRDVPVHVANEYCRTDRSFDPRPEFNEETLPRNFEFYNYTTYGLSSWFPLVVSASSGLGVDFAVSHGSPARPSAGPAPIGEVSTFTQHARVSFDLAAVKIK
jgi:hypothetical protein